MLTRQPAAAPREVSPDSTAAMLRAIRAKAGLSQEELARLANVSCHSIKRWENGTREPKYADVQKILKAVEGIPPGGGNVVS